MKKTIKRLTITTIALFAILGVSGTIAYASGYITWAGTQDYQQTLVNLDLIAERGEQLKAEKQNLIDIYVERSTDYVNEIISLEQQIEVLEKRIAGGETAQDMLQQAEQDMADVERKSAEVLEGLQND